MEACCAMASLKTEFIMLDVSLVLLRRLLVGKKGKAFYKDVVKLFLLAFSPLDNTGELD